jgi:hypothetical protein
MTRTVISMTIDDVDHYDADRKAQIIASYPAHEREARAKGIPTLGSGRIFPIAEDRIKVPAMAIPKHWARVIGVDFGVDHPFAAVCLAWDRDADCVYVTDVYRQRGEHVGGEWTGSAVFHAGALRGWGSWIPVAWPHDGLAQDRQSGEALAAIYKSHGLNMLPERATWPDGGNGVEAGLMAMLERMQTNKLKVFSHLEDWFEEFRLYHRKDGKIVKLRDDVLSATRYGVMMLRYAAVQKTWGDFEHNAGNSWLSA